MNLEVLITCVDYADFLDITLPISKQFFEFITVVTAPNDIETLEIARRCKVHTYITNIWYENGAKFNKAAALNECLIRFRERKDECWVLLLDADILFSENINMDISKLDKRGLYSIRRRMCKDEIQWRDFTMGNLKWEDFPLHIPPTTNGKVWGTLPTSNPAALCGYVQLWNLNYGLGMKYLPNSVNAASYDAKFALSFPETMRKYLENREVLHLGQSNMNWNGRTSERWHSVTKRREEV